MSVVRSINVLVHEYIFLDQKKINTLLTWNGVLICISVINLSTVLSIEMII